MATGAVISMIPIVDQICDVRDIIANGKKIKEDTTDTFAWIALVFTLIGLIPILGSALKGCLKILFSPIRRLYLKVGRKMSASALTETIEYGIKQLMDFLDTLVVQKALKELNISNPLKVIAENLQKLKVNLNTAELCEILDGIIKVIRDILDKIEPYLPKSIIKKCNELWDDLENLKKLSHKQIANALSPIKDLLERFINRLHHESDDVFRAQPGTNFHKINRIKDSDIIQRTDKLPSYYRPKNDEILKEIVSFEDDYKKLVNKGYPDLDSKTPPLNEAYKTFNTLEPVDIEAGTVLVRVIDPKSYDNAICWMLEADFKKLKSRDEWRELYAVKTEWNANGEYITYTVPEGEALKAWQGKAASQEVTVGEKVFYLPGGNDQIVLNPEDLDRLAISERKATNWGYGEVEYQDNGITYIGVPDLTQNIGNWFKQ